MFRFGRVVCIFLVFILLGSSPAEARTRSRPNIMGMFAGVIAGAAMAGAIQNAVKCKKRGDQGLGGTAGNACGGSTAMQKSRPSVELRRNLNIERQAAGLPPDPPGCDAHHIVAEGDARTGIKQYTDAARKIIKNCIDINAAENGIFLPGKEGGEGCEGPHNHRAIHNKKYYLPIMERLDAGEKLGGCQGVREALGKIKEILRNGGMP